MLVYVAGEWHEATVERWAKFLCGKTVEHVNGGVLITHFPPDEAKICEVCRQAKKG